MDKLIQLKQLKEQVRDLEYQVTQCKNVTDKRVFNKLLKQVKRELTKLRG